MKTVGKNPFIMNRFHYRMIIAPNFGTDAPRWLAFAQVS